MNYLFNLYTRSKKVNVLIEVLSGLTVSIALVPEAIAFALIAGLSPLTGLYAAFSIGLITSLFGGRPGMISGATGAIAVVIVSLAQSHGVEYIFATVILAGIIQMAAGFLRLGKVYPPGAALGDVRLRQRTRDRHLPCTDGLLSSNGRRRPARLDDRPSAQHYAGLSLVDHVHNLGSAEIH